MSFSALEVNKNKLQVEVIDLEHQFATLPTQLSKSKKAIIAFDQLNSIRRASRYVKELKDKILLQEAKIEQTEAGFELSRLGFINMSPEKIDRYKAWVTNQKKHVRCWRESIGYTMKFLNDNVRINKIRLKNLKETCSDLSELYDEEFLPLMVRALKIGYEERRSKLNAIRELIPLKNKEIKVYELAMKQCSARADMGKALFIGLLAALGASLNVYWNKLIATEHASAHSDQSH